MSEHFEYIVQPGDDMGNIAKQFEVSIFSIIAMNKKLSCDNFSEGMKISIPVNPQLYEKYPWYIYNPYHFIHTRQKKKDAHDVPDIHLKWPR